MPHMDSGPGMGDVEYSDHEVQAIGINAQSEESGNTVATFDIEPVSQRGIDSDELAELVGFYRYASLVPQGTSTNSGNAFNGDLSFGINTIDESEQFADASTRAEIENVPRDDGGAGEIRIGEIDDPGVLDGTSVNLRNGTSGIPTTERTVNFHEMLGTGPFVDRTDELAFTVELGAADNDTVRLEAGYILYWNVHEMEGGRSAFARP